jgi:hypothetical protein
MAGRTAVAEDQSAALHALFQHLNSRVLFAGIQLDSGNRINMGVPMTNAILRLFGLGSNKSAWGSAYLLVITGIGLYCLGISALGRLAFAYGYRPEAHSLILFIRYLQPMLVFPFFLVSLIPRKWSTFPLWVVCLSVCSFPFAVRDAELRTLLGYWNSPFGLRAAKEIAMIMVIPVIVQMAVWIRARHNARQVQHGGPNLSGSGQV